MSRNIWNAELVHRRSAAGASTGATKTGFAGRASGFTRVECCR